MLAEEHLMLQRAVLALRTQELGRLYLMELYSRSFRKLTILEASLLSDAVLCQALVAAEETEQRRREPKLAEQEQTGKQSPRSTQPQDQLMLPKEVLAPRLQELGREYLQGLYSRSIHTLVSLEATNLSDAVIHQSLDAAAKNEQRRRELERKEQEEVGLRPRPSCPQIDEPHVTQTGLSALRIQEIGRSYLEALYKTTIFRLNSLEQATTVERREGSDAFDAAKEAEDESEVAEAVVTEQPQDTRLSAKPEGAEQSRDGRLPAEQVPAARKPGDQQVALRKEVLLARAQEHARWYLTELYSKMLRKLECRHESKHQSNEEDRSRQAPETAMAINGVNAEEFSQTCQEESRPSVSTAPSEDDAEGTSEGFSRNASQGDLSVYSLSSSIIAPSTVATSTVKIWRLATLEAATLFDCVVQHSLKAAEKIERRRREHLLAEQEQIVKRRRLSMQIEERLMLQREVLALRTQEIGRLYLVRLYKRSSSKVAERHQHVRRETQQECVQFLQQRATEARRVFDNINAQVLRQDEARETSQRQERQERHRRRQAKAQAILARQAEKAARDRLQYEKQHQAKVKAAEAHHALRSRARAALERWSAEAVARELVGLVVSQVDQEWLRQELASQQLREAFHRRREEAFSWLSAGACRAQQVAALEERRWRRSELQRKRQATAHDYLRERAAEYFLEEQRRAAQKEEALRRAHEAREADYAARLARRTKVAEAQRWLTCCGAMACALEGQYKSRVNLNRRKVDKRTLPPVRTRAVGSAPNTFRDDDPAASDGAGTGNKLSMDTNVEREFGLSSRPTSRERQHFTPQHIPGGTRAGSPAGEMRALTPSELKTLRRRKELKASLLSRKVRHRHRKRNDAPAKAKRHKSKVKDRGGRSRRPRSPLHPNSADSLQSILEGLHATEEEGTFVDAWNRKIEQFTCSSAPALRQAVSALKPTHSRTTPGAVLLAIVDTHGDLDIAYDQLRSRKYFEHVLVVSKLLLLDANFDQILRDIVTRSEPRPRDKEAVFLKQAISGGSGSVYFSSNAAASAFAQTPESPPELTQSASIVSDLALTLNKQHISRFEHEATPSPKAFSDAEKDELVRL